MNLLTISKKTIFMLCALLFSVIAWGQEPTPTLSLLDPDADYNAETNPYVVANAEDWGKLATDVAGGYSYEGEVIKLTADITVSAMVGDDSNGFSGIFDGNYGSEIHTLTFNYTGTNDDDYIAPFYNTTNAVIQNITVAGTISSSCAYVAGLVYYNEGTTTVQNVTVSAHINAASVATCGGFAIYGGGLSFDNCVYNGQFVAGSSCGGFAANNYYGDSSFSNCLFDPAEGSSISSGKTFGTGTVTSCYYTDNLGITAQGTKVYTNPTDFIGKKVDAFPTYYKPVNVVVNVEDKYEYNAETNHYSTIMSNYNVTFDGDVPTITTDYTVAITYNGEETTDVINKGDYALVITGAGNYAGSFKKDFYVIADIALQDPESAYNATTNPYVITCAADWIKLSENVSAGTNADKSYKLTADITVTDMVGTSTYPFSGTFSGRIGDTYGAYTLTFNYGTAEHPTEDEIVAPFRYTDGATIQSLILRGVIHTNVGKEAGLIGVNTYTNERATTVLYVINYMNFYCYEALWDAEGGGYAYDGSYVHFSYSSYEGFISASNYHGGFCGKANGSTTFERCLFDPKSGGIYWAENFVYDAQGANINYDGPTSAEDGCYYTVGNNQEESEQGTMVYVNEVPDGYVGHKITDFHEKKIYKPVEVVISGVNKRYLYTGSVITITPGVEFDKVNALSNNYCEWSIDPETVKEVGLYTLTITAPKAGTPSDYKGTVTMLIRVVEESSEGWTGLQTKLSGSDATINLDGDITAGTNDVCLVVESGRTVTINLNGHKIDRGFYNGNDDWDSPVVGGHVFKILSGATVVIYGNNAENPTSVSGIITGGCNKASTNAEHAENSDAGGIFNMGSLTLNNVTVQGNYCEKKSTGISRTARGGGIYSGSGSILIINGGKISHNAAQGGGGGLYSEKASVFEMNGVEISSNTSNDKGGGIRVDANGTKHNSDAKGLITGAMIKNCHIKTNQVELHNSTSASNGGGIHIDDGTIYIEGGSIDGNFASKYGGGIYIMKGVAHVKDCSIINNRSYDWESLFEGYGGGVCILGGTYYMDGGTVSNNFSYVEDGGGIFVAAGKSLHISGNVNITNNWKYNAAYTQTTTTNVYLAGSSNTDVIHIDSDFNNKSFIGISKAHDGSNPPGVITSGLSGKGTIANFMSDHAYYQILPDSGEAKLGVPAEMPSVVDDDNLPDGMEKDNVNDEYVIKVPFTIGQTVEIAKTVRFDDDGCIIITENGILRVPSITNNDPLKIIIDDGGQIIFTGSPGNVAARSKKEVIEFEKVSYNNWYLISSSVCNPVVSTETNIVVLNPDMIEPTPGYDLYRFNEAATENAQHEILQWENYRNTTAHPDFTRLANGRGYLYRSCQDYTLNIDGNLNVGEVTSYTLTNSGTNVLKGFNIIGNPYPHNIKKGEDQAIPNTYLKDKYYVLNPTGCTWDLTDDGTEIPPFTGILVQANSSVTNSQTLTISDIAASSGSSKGVGEYKSSNEEIQFTVANNKYEDRACIEFRKGHGLNKISHLNEDAPMLYVNYNGEKFASADVNPAAKVVNLNFEAKTTGMFTLSCKAKGNFSYLHLYDRLTGNDVDMLLEGEYSFIASPTDNENRFLVVLDPLENLESLDGTFAFQNGNDIIVNGNGELQIFDVMGRLIATQRVNGVETVNVSTTGVYIFKLNEKTQKIVVR